MTPLEQEVVEFVENNTRSRFSQAPTYPAHDILHVERIAMNALQICEGDQVIPFKPVIAAWLHENGRSLEWEARQKGEKLHHSEESAKLVPIILYPYREALGNTVIEEIQVAVANHSRLNSDEDSLTGSILKDADRLDGLGAIGLMRTFNDRSGFPAYTMPNIFGEGLKPLASMTPESMTQLEFPLVNVEWYFMLRSETAKRLAIPKLKMTILYLRQFATELGISPDLLDQHPVIVQAKNILSPTVFSTIDLNSV